MKHVSLPSVLRVLQTPHSTARQTLRFCLALLFVAATGAACEPGQFDARRKPNASASDAANGRGSDTKREAGMPRSERDAEMRASNTPDAGLAQAAVDAGTDAASEVTDSGGDKGGQPDASVCSAPRAGQALPLAVVPDSARVIARVANPSGVVAREVIAIKPQAGKLLWTLMISPAAEMAKADGGVTVPSRYASVARTPLSGPWNSSAGPAAAPISLALEEHLGASGLPTPLIPLDLQPSVGNEPVHMGLVVTGSTASIFLKQYYAFASVASFLGSLKAGEYTLQSKLIELFRVDQNQPTFGTGAFDRMGEVYSFACQYDAKNQANYPCTLGRSADQTLDDSTSYETYRGSPPAEQGFTHMLDQGTPLFSGSERMSLSFNKHLGLWLLVTSAGGDKNEGVAYLRSAPLPEGPWSDPVAVTLPRTPGGLTVFFAAEHPELAQNCGQRLVLSYLEPSSMFVFGQQFPGTIALMTLELQ